MESRPAEIVPLKENEKQFLLPIFYKRLKFLLSVYAVLITMAVIYSPSGNDSRGKRWEDTEDANYVSRLGMQIIKLGFMGSILKRIFPFNRLIFLAIDDPDYLHHEIGRNLCPMRRGRYNEYV